MMCSVPARLVLLACVHLLLPSGRGLSSGVHAAAGVQESVEGGQSQELRHQVAILRTPGDHVGPFRPSQAPSLEGSAVEYLILTNDSMAPEFARLAAWKTRKGVPAVVRTLEDARAAALPGSDLAETLRNYIRDAYQLWGVRFVLLGGDTDVIPVRTVAMQLLDFPHPISDLYYSCLDGTWNADGDGLFGEPPPNPSDPGDDTDLVSEVFLGRAPVSTAGEAAIFVDKSLRHEHPLQQDFQQKFLFLAEVLFPTDYDPAGPLPSADGALFAEEIAALLPSWMQAQKLYEAQALWPGSSGLTRGSATAAIDAGPGTVVHIGHGYRYTLSCADGSLNTGDASSFTNGSRAGLFYLLNCTATAFDFESMAEALLLNPDGGANVVVGSAREAFPVTARTYQRAFFEQLYQLGERRVGVAMTNSRHRFVTGFLPTVERWTHLVYTLLGDPELPIWSRTLNMQVQDVPTTLRVGTQDVSVVVSDADGPLPGALLCFSKDGDEYRVAWTDSQGVAQVQLQPGTPGNMELTVTAFDHLPIQQTLAVTAAGATLSLGPARVQDDAGPASNGDGHLDAGETVLLHLPLRNAGSTAVTSIATSLVSDDPSVQVRQGTSAYADLEAGAEAEGLSPFEVEIAPDVPDGFVVGLWLDVQHAAGDERHRVELLVHAARLRLVDMRLDDSRAGNGNGEQEAGESVDLFYSLENRGSGSAWQVRLRLQSLDALLEVLVDSVDVARIAPGATRESGAALVVRESDVTAAHGASLRLLHRQAASAETVLFDLRRPPSMLAPRFGLANASDAIQLEWDAADVPDRLGYRVYRASAATGPFAAVGPDWLLHGSFRDEGLDPSQRYYYRVAVVDRAFLEGPPSPVASASTNPPQLPGWPLDALAFTASTPSVADVDGDGDLDIITAADQVLAWDARGIELDDADQNALTWGVFYGNREIFGSVAIADMDLNPGKEIVTATWDSQDRFVAVVNRQGQNLPGWPQNLLPTNEALRGAQVPPVVANLDGEGAPEILLAARDGRLYGWHADGSEIADGDASAATHGVFLDTGSSFLRCAPAVADLDPARPGQEIVLGSSDGKLYVLDAQGRALPGWPRTGPVGGEPFGDLFASGICIADLNLDGEREIVCLESAGRLHALHLDGSERAGFPVAGIVASSNTVVPSPAVGDIVGDGALEIVVAGSDGRVFLFDAQGSPLLPAPLDSGTQSESSPLLGDLDGDGQIEILFGNEDGLLHAWNLDGTPTDGFPIVLGSEVRATPVLADADQDGEADLLVQSWDGSVTLWGLGVPWTAESFPWPVHRGSNHRTGEHGFAVPTPVRLSDLQGLDDAERGIRISWVAAVEGKGARWRLRRAGPFASDPLLGEASWERDAVVVRELDGGGFFDVLDSDVSHPGWYGYVIEVAEDDAVLQRAGAIAVLRAAPQRLQLHGAVPNPFNPSTRIAFDLPALGGVPMDVTVRLDVLDLRGRLVRRLLTTSLAAGRHGVVWDGRDDSGREVPSGVYLARLQAAERVVSRKLTLLR